MDGPPGFPLASVDAPRPVRMMNAARTRVKPPRTPLLPRPQDIPPRRHGKRSLRLPRAAALLPLTGPPERGSAIGSKAISW